MHNMSEDKAHARHVSFPLVFDRPNPHLHVSFPFRPATSLLHASNCLLNCLCCQQELQPSCSPMHAQDTPRQLLPTCKRRIYPPLLGYLFTSHLSSLRMLGKIPHINVELSLLFQLLHQLELHANEDTLLSKTPMLPGCLTKGEGHFHIPRWL